MNISTIDLTPIEPLIDSIRRQYINGLKYGWKSNVSKEYDHGHWNNTILPDSKVMNYDQNQLHYIEHHPAIAELWSHITDTIGERTLVRAYVNGYTFGTDAYYHKDDIWLQQEFGEDVVSETVLIYLNEEWNRDWGGETNFIDDNDEIIASVLPKRNRCVVFDSDMWHRATSVSRSCPELRSVIVFKTAGAEYNRPFVKWIKDRTEFIPHSDTTLFRHLYDTAMTIESMKGVSPDAVKAGLYHSIYGTQYFDPELGVTREEVIEQIGNAAENYVHLFCSLTDRYNQIINNSENWNKETHLALLLIELANTLEMSTRQTPNADRNERIAKLDEIITNYDRTV